VSDLPPPFELGLPGTDLRRRLVTAVLRGEKTATAGLAGDEPPPRPGDRFTLHDAEDLPVGIVEVTEARVVPAGAIDERFARDEGEGFESVADWRLAHERFFERELDDDVQIEAIRFRLADLVVARRYRGPARSGNGGYTCGLVAQLAGGEAEVTLRVPPPLDTPLRIEGHRVLAGETLVAEAVPTRVELELPEPVRFDEARRLEGPPDPDHPFPGCFVCGPEGEGLRLRPTPVGDGRVVAPWRAVAPTVEHVWAALDCPGAFAVDPGFARGVSVLGRLAAHVEEVPADGEELVVVAWDLGGRDGRRSYAGTALFREETPLAWGRAVWFAVGDEVRDPLRSAR
jgi:uncharacterized protein YhfF